MIDLYLSLVHEVEKTGLLEGATNEVNILNQEANDTKYEINKVGNENNKNVKLSQYTVLEGAYFNDVHKNMNKYLFINYFKIIDKNVEKERISAGISIENGLEVYILVTSSLDKEGILITIQIN